MRKPDSDAAYRIVRIGPEQTQSNLVGNGLVIEQFRGGCEEDAGATQVLLSPGHDDLGLHGLDCCNQGSVLTSR